MHFIILRAHLGQLLSNLAKVGTFSVFGQSRHHVSNRNIVTVTPRYNAGIGRHLLGPPYKRGAPWDLVDLYDIVILRLG